MQREHSLKINFINKNIVNDNLVSNKLKMFSNKKISHSINFILNNSGNIFKRSCKQNLY